MSSAVGLVAAAGCIGTGFVALTSHVLPFSGWSGDMGRSDAAQTLPAARAAQIASVSHASPLSTGRLAPAIFVSGATTARVTVPGSADRSGRAAVVRGSVAKGPSHRSAGTRRRAASSTGSSRSTGDARQGTADAPTAAAPAAPATTAAVAAVSAPAAAPAATTTPTTRQWASTSTGSSFSSNRHGDGDRNGRRGHRWTRDDGGKTSGSASRSDRSAAASGTPTVAQRPAATSAANAGGNRHGNENHGNRGHAGGDRWRGNDNRQPAQAPAQAQPAPAAAAQPAGNGATNGRGHGGGDWRRGRSASSRSAIPTPAPAPAAPATAPAAPTPAPAPQPAWPGGQGHGGDGRGPDGRHGR